MANNWKYRMKVCGISDITHPASGKVEAYRVSFHETPGHGFAQGPFGGRIETDFCLVCEDPKAFNIGDTVTVTVDKEDAIGKNKSEYTG